MSIHKFIRLLYVHALWACWHQLYIQSTDFLICAPARAFNAVAEVSILCLQLKLVYSNLLVNRFELHVHAI